MNGFRGSMIPQEEEFEEEPSRWRVTRGEVEYRGGTRTQEKGDGPRAKKFSTPTQKRKGKLTESSLSSGFGHTNNLRTTELLTGRTSSITVCTPEGTERCKRMRSDTGRWRLEENQCFGRPLWSTSVSEEVLGQDTYLRLVSEPFSVLVYDVVDLVRDTIFDVVSSFNAGSNYFCCWNNL